MKQPENQSKKYSALFSQIDEGYVKIPQFQRDFVWSKDQTAMLIDSIIKGFPIGTFILWKTREELLHRNIGNAEIRPVPKGDSVQYVLDGQQRITSLYAVRKGLILTKEGKEIHYKDICINLNADPDNDEEVVSAEPTPDVKSVSVYDLLNVKLTEFIGKFSNDEIAKIETYKSRLEGYDFSTIVIDNYPIDVACDVFTRTNTGGKDLTLFEIMVAKTYDHEKKFDLAEKFQQLLDNGQNGDGKNLEDAGYETIPNTTVLQCVAACVDGQIKSRTILKISKAKFIDNWEAVKDALFCAVEFARTTLRIPVSKLIPYDAQLIPLTYFFFKNKGKPATLFQSKLLTQYFFWSALSNRFSSAVESKIGQDLKRIDMVLEGQPAKYEKAEEIKLTVDDLRHYWFSTGDAFCKAILCIYVYHQPKSFDSNNLVQLDNSWLKIRSSKNYHHFFPKAFLKKKGVEEWKANSILNITIIDDYLNKREIKTRPPSQYLKKFKPNNEHFLETMKTHLIDDLADFGVWNDDYDRFLDKRSHRLLEEINKRLSPNVKNLDPDQEAHPMVVTMATKATDIPAETQSTDIAFGVKLPRNKFDRFVILTMMEGGTKQVQAKKIGEKYPPNAETGADGAGYFIDNYKTYSDRLKKLQADAGS